MSKNKDRDSFFSGFFWKFNEQITAQLVSFIVSIVLARILSPSDYGLVSLVNVFIILANVFVTSGFGTALIQKKDATELDFSTIFYCSFVFSLFLYVVLFICAPYIGDFYHNDKVVSVVRVYGLALPIAAFNSIQQAYIARKIAFRKIFISTSAASILSGVIGIICAFLGFGVWALVIQSLSNSIISTIVLFIQIPWRPKLLFSFKEAKILLDYGWKVLAADFIGTFFGQLRNLVIGRYYSTASLAYYNRGDQFPNLISTNVDSSISTVLFPVMSKHGDDLVRLKAMVRRSLRTSTYLIMPLMFGLAAVAKPLIQLLLTDKWLPAVPFMQILCVSNAFATVTNTNLQVLKASGRSDVLLKLELVKKPVYLVLLIIGIKYGVMMVAVTMLIYSVYAAIVNMSPNKKVINYGIKEQLSDIVPSLLLSILMFIAVKSLEYLNISSVLTLLVQIIVGILIYILGSVISRMESFAYLSGYLRGMLKKGE